MPADLPIPYPEAGPKGDVGIYWRNRNVHTFAHVLFAGDRKFAFIANIKHPNLDEERNGGEELPVKSPWPNDLVTVIRFAYDE